MKQALFFLIGLLVLFPGRISAQEPGPCPAETTLSRRSVTFFTSSRSDAESRSKYGLPTVDSARVRLLTRERDAETCIRLRRSVANFRRHPSAGQYPVPGVVQLPVFYEAGGYYYVYLDLEPRKEPTQPGQIHVDMRWRSLFVLDRDFNQVAGLAM